jgi:hypothetical protein
MYKRAGYANPVTPKAFFRERDLIYFSVTLYMVFLGYLRFSQGLYLFFRVYILFARFIYFFLWVYNLCGHF